jgi:hypothetical protein
MEGTGKPEYDKCVAISTKAAIREMILPGSLALVVPVVVGFIFGPEVLGGLLAGVTVSGVLMAIFQSNAGGAWDNAKKSFEKGVMINGVMTYKGSEAHKASVTGDTVGDPFKDTSGPSMNILIKLMSIMALVIAPHIRVDDGAHGHGRVSAMTTQTGDERIIGMSDPRMVEIIEKAMAESNHIHGPAVLMSDRGEFMMEIESANVLRNAGDKVTGINILFNASEAATGGMEGINLRPIFVSRKVNRVPNDDMRYIAEGYIDLYDGKKIRASVETHIEMENSIGEALVRLTN